jgi:hypothetical protein
MDRTDLLKEMILDYRGRIDTYQRMIQEWERELGVPVSASTSSTPSASEQSKGTMAVNPWQFLGKSQPEAAKALLLSVGHPLTTEQIMEGIKKGGVEVGGNKYTFYTILSRNDGLVLFRPNTWGLSEWPGAQKRKESKPKKKKKGNGKKPQPKPSPKAKAAPTDGGPSSSLAGPELQILAEQVINEQGGEVEASTVLRALKERGHEIAQLVLASALRRSVERGRIARVRQGVYRSVQPSQG